MDKSIVEGNQEGNYSPEKISGCIMILYGLLFPVFICKFSHGFYLDKWEKSSVDIKIAILFIIIMTTVITAFAIRNGILSIQDRPKEITFEFENTQPPHHDSKRTKQHPEEV